MFRCLISFGRESKKKGNKVTMERVELLWKEKEYYTSANLNERLFILSDLLDIDDVVVESDE